MVVVVFVVVMVVIIIYNTSTPKIENNTKAIWSLLGEERNEKERKKNKQKQEK